MTPPTPTHFVAPIATNTVDGYTQRSGFPLTAADQIAYNTWLADTAHSLGLAVGLKNDIAQVAELAPKFDFFVNEQCMQYSECGLYAPAKAGALQSPLALSLSPFCASRVCLWSKAAARHRCLRQIPHTHTANNNSQHIHIHNTHYTIHNTHYYHSRQAGAQR